MVMRIVFMGTPRFSCPALEALRRTGHEVALVVTQPDKPRGRSGRPAPSEVKQLAQRLGLPIAQPEDVNAAEVLSKVREVRPDVTVTAAYGQRLGNDLLAVPRLGGINVHASLLPKYRGAAPIAWAIVGGETKTGITIFRMAERMDAGEIIAQAATPIGPDETAGELTERLASLGAELLVKTLEDLAAGRAAFRPQDPKAATRAPMLKKEDGAIDWTRPAAELRNVVRGMTPWPGAFTYHLAAGRDPIRLSLLAVEAVAADEQPYLEPGTVVTVTKGGISVAAGRGQLRLLRLKPAGGRELSAEEYARGHATRPGDRFVRM
jgi:methionyl-tRNA formyltransferase